MEKIAVLVTCYNRVQKTIRSLTALYKSVIPESCSLEIFLVDDGSTDGTGTEVIKKFPLAKVIKGNGHFFWNRGMYTAWTAAERGNPDYYLWLNDDTFIFKNSISELLTSARVTEGKAIICGNTCSEYNCEKVTYGGIGANKKLVKPNGLLQKIDHFQGNFALVPKFVYEQVGKLDPFFHHAIGDLDYGLRAKKMGIESYTAPNFVGTCENHETLPKWCIKTVSFKERIKNLYSPLGNSHPYYYFKFEYRHFGLITAIKHCFSIHLRVIAPSLWKI